MRTVLKKAPLRGTIAVPGDKSITHRGVIFAALAEGPSEVVGYLPSEDCERTIAAFQEMGVSITVETVDGVPRFKSRGKGSGDCPSRPV